ncbi:MAG: hypothetical protein ACRCZR_03090, partial [Cetobacterium sp.]
MRIKDKKKFLRFLILLIIFIFTISCGIKRFVLSDNPQTIEMVNDEIKVDVLSLNKDSAPLKLKNKILVEPTEEITILDSEEKEVVEKKNLKYVKNQNLYVFEDETENKRQDILRKGTKIEILEEKKINKNDKEKSLLKIAYRKDLKNKEGWVNKVEFAENLNETLPSNWKNIDFKTEYSINNFENNPRVDVKGVYLN